MKILKEHVKEKHESQTVFRCEICEYESILENNVLEHKKNKHQKKTSENASLRKKNDEKKLCIFWNHGSCRNGYECRFVHEEIPACQYQDNCQKFQCSLYHFDKSLNSFLGRSQEKRTHPNY